MKDSTIGSEFFFCFLTFYSSFNDTKSISERRNL